MQPHDPNTSNRSVTSVLFVADPADSLLDLIDHFCSIECGVKASARLSLMAFSQNCFIATEDV